MTTASSDSIVTRAAEHMIRQHGRHAADFADARCRELRATGNAEAGALWAEVANRIREMPGDSVLDSVDTIVA
jgi:hypothetical protein